MEFCLEASLPGKQYIPVKWELTVEFLALLGEYGVAEIDVTAESFPGLVDKYIEQVANNNRLEDHLSLIRAQRENFTECVIAIVPALQPRST